MFAQMMRQVFEENPGKVGSLLKQATKASKTVCGCGQWHCELCGFALYNKRVQKIRKNESITGYLTGGPQIMGKC
jgi:hypothetical protein